MDKSRVNEFGFSGEMEDDVKTPANGQAIENTRPETAAIEAKPSPQPVKPKSKKDKKRD